MTFSPGDRVRVLELDVAGRVADVVAGDPPLQRRRNPPRSSWRIGAASSPRECQVPRCFALWAGATFRVLRPWGRRQAGWEFKNVAPGLGAFG